ncbi:MAG: hypothetical protein AAGA23_09275 [Pseudomonadota bacterium]
MDRSFALAICLAGPLALAGTVVPVHAGGGDFLPPTHTFFNQALFIEATGAADLTGPLPQLPTSVTQQPVGRVTYVAHPPSSLNFSEWTIGLEDDYELALNGDEEFNLVPDIPLYSLGIQVEEASAQHPNINAPFADSTFVITLCAARFPAGAECPEPDVIDTVQLNAPESAPTYRPWFFGVWSDQPVAQLSIREITDGPDGNEFFGRVFGGEAPLPTPELDQYEGDNQPDTASDLALDLFAFRPVRYEQAHTFHLPTDEDWILTTPPPQDLLLELTSNQPEFHASLAVYPPARLTDPTVEPLLTIGDCAGVPGPVMFRGFYPVQARLLQVVNCGSVTPLRYDLYWEVVEPGSAEGGVTAGGQVVLEGTGEPLGVFLQSTTGAIVFSNPGSGQFSLFVGANTPLTLTLVSPFYEADPAFIPGAPEFQSPPPATIIARPRVEILSDGFEADP